MGRPPTAGGFPRPGGTAAGSGPVFHRQHRWHEAAVLQEEALQLATTRAEEAGVRHQIGRRLFNEARYRDAAEEFQWASDLYRVSGRHELAERSRQAMEGSRKLLNQA